MPDASLLGAIYWGGARCDCDRAPAEIRVDDEVSFVIVENPISSDTSMQFIRIRVTEVRPMELGEALDFAATFIRGALISSGHDWVRVCDGSGRDVCGGILNDRSARILLTSDD